MLSTSTKVFAIMLIVAVVLAIVFGFLWQNTSSRLKETQNDLLNANSTIVTLQNDNEKLLTYITERDTKIKQLEAKYKEKINNIPADQCGDTKPSKELLEYFRKGVNNE